MKRFIAFLLMLILSFTMLMPTGFSFAESAAAEDAQDLGGYAQAGGEAGDLQARAVSNWRDSFNNLSHASKFASRSITPGIDVSAWQGDIDWEKVADAGIKFAIVRVGYRGWGYGEGSGLVYSDSRAASYIRGAKAAGLKVGAYFYSHATTKTEAKEEAKLAVKVLQDNNLKLDLPLFMDYEYTENSGDRMRHYASRMSQSQMTDYALAFCTVVKQAGYTPGLYASKSFLEYSLYGQQVAEAGNVIWLAHWNSSTSYSGDYDYWQYDVAGQAAVPGISTSIDLDVWYNASLKDPSVGYRAWMPGSGWRNFVYNGSLCGTTQQSLGLKALKTRLVSKKYPDSGVSVRVKMQNKSWGDWTTNPDIAGTPGAERSIGAVKFKLTGPIRDDYDLYYCVRLRGVGWLPWVKNGESTGSAGKDCAVEGLKVKLVKKGNDAPKDLSSGKLAFYDTVNVLYNGRVATMGWQKKVRNGARAGTIGSDLPLMAFRARLSTSSPLSGTIKYRAYVNGKGWLPWHTSDNTAGTSSVGRRMEAMEVVLTGKLAQYYDVYYCVYSEHYGWFNWAKNGKTAGTIGKDLRAEAFRIKVVPKGSPAPAQLGRFKVRAKIA